MVPHCSLSFLVPYDSSLFLMISPLMVVHFARFEVAFCTIYKSCQNVRIAQFAIVRDCFVLFRMITCTMHFANCESRNTRIVSCCFVYVRIRSYNVTYFLA